MYRLVKHNISAYNHLMIIIHQHIYFYVSVECENTEYRLFIDTHIFQPKIECKNPPVVQATYSGVNLPADNYAFLANGIEKSLNFTGLPAEKCLDKLVHDIAKLTVIFQRQTAVKASLGYGTDVKHQLVVVGGNLALFNGLYILSFTELLLWLILHVMPSSRRSKLMLVKYALKNFVLIQLHFNYVIA